MRSMADAGDEGQPAPDPDDQPAHRRVDLAVGPARHDVVEPADLLAGLVAHRPAEEAGQRDDGVEDALGREDAAGAPAALVRRALRVAARRPGSRRVARAARALAGGGVAMELPPLARRADLVGSVGTAGGVTATPGSQRPAPASVRAPRRGSRRRSWCSSAGDGTE